MRLLAFGDPEGVLQKYKSRYKIIQKHNPDFVIFLGDYFSSPITYYYKLLRGVLYPEAKLIKGIEKNYKFVFVYGNKDINPEILGLKERKLKRKRENWILNLDLWGKSFDFFIVNGSNVLFEIPQIKKAVECIKELKEKYNIKGLLIESKYLEKIKEEVIKKYPSQAKLLFGVYYTNYKNLRKVKTKNEILLTHTPPLLKKEKLIWGFYPDLAIYKKYKGGVLPARPNEKGAIKRNVGNKNIRKFILKNNFRLVLSGHIHEGSGIALLKNTLVINPGSIVSHTNKKKVIPWVFVELKERKVKVKINSWIGYKELCLEV